MIGSARTIRSPSRVRARRSTPWVAGCCGPMLRTMSAVAMSPVATVSSRRSPVVTSPAMPRILARRGSAADPDSTVQVERLDRVYERGHRGGIGSPVVHDEPLAAGHLDVDEVTVTGE